MPGRFPLTPVPLLNDPFCGGPFCGGPFCDTVVAVTAVEMVVVIRSFYDSIQGGLLFATCTPPGPNPPPPSIIVPPVLGIGGHSFYITDSPQGNYGYMSISVPGGFEYVIDKENPVVLGLSPYSPPNYTSVYDTFKFVMVDGCGNADEGEITVRIDASYVRYAMLLQYQSIPPTSDYGKWAWVINTELISTLANPNTTFFGANYPWTVVDPESPNSLYLAGYTDGASPVNWLAGGPPFPLTGEGFIDYP
jgi:VCBS repeat-containing protein